MPRLDAARQKAINEVLKESKDVEIYNLPAYAGGSDVTKFLNDVKNVLTRNKGKDVMVIVGIRLD